MYKKTKLKIIMDALSGSLFLLAILVYVLVGVFTSVWHPTWVILLCASIACALISIITSAVIKCGDKSEDK